MKCPRCGSNETAKILYGLPSYSDDLQREMDDGKVVLGGCRVGEYDPKYHCNDCEKDFGTPPILRSKDHGDEPYPLIVQSIHFGDGGFFDGYYDLRMKANGGAITMEVDAPFKERSVSRQLQLEEWTDIIDTLYNKLYLHEWKKRFEAPRVMDGEQWELEIGLTGNRERRYCGNNAFPPYWNELKELFAPFLAEAQQELE